MITIAERSKLSRRYAGPAFGGNIRQLKDQITQEDVIMIPSGGFYVTTDDNEVLTTVLGSCVAACMRDPYANVGGMNHFLRPNGQKSPASSSRVTKFGNYAMETLINEILSRGGRRSRLEIKIFGGGNMFEGSMPIGEYNVGFVEGYLRKEGMAIAAKHVGGQQARCLRYWPMTGKARMLLLSRQIENELVQDEQSHSAPPPQMPVNDAC